MGTITQKKITNNNRNDCAFIYTNGKWHHLICYDQQHGYICEIPTDTAALTHSQAKGDCAARGGRLAEPKTAEDNAAVSQMAWNMVAIHLWIGVHDRITEGTWVYESDSQRPISYSQWAPCQLNDLTGQDCAVFNYIVQQHRGKLG